MSTFDDLLVESPAVKAEMKRLRRLHGVYEMALRMAIADGMEAESPGLPKAVEVDKRLARYLRLAEERGRPAPKRRLAWMLVDHEASLDLTYEFVRAYTAEHGFAPTVREVMTGCGLSSTSAAHRRLVRLVEDGRLVRKRVSSRREVYAVPDA